MTTPLEVKKVLTLSIYGRSEVREFTDETAHLVLREAVGGHLEHIHLPTLGVDMWVNEEGKLKHLPPNQFATYLWIDSYGTRANGYVDVIAGNAAFTKGTDDEGNTTGLSEDDIVIIKKMIERVL